MGTVLVVGAGIFGITAALELRRRGHVVSVLDPGPLPHPDAASTDASKIVRLDYGAQEAYTELMERALSGWRAWNRGWPEPLFHEEGLLVLSRGPLAPGSFEGDSLAVLRRRGHAPQVLGQAELAARHPAWNSRHFAHGYWNPEGGWAESGKVVAALVREARIAGIATHAGCGATALLQEGQRVVGVQGTDGARHHAEQVVVAAGAWTPLLLPHLQGVLQTVGQPVLLFRPAAPERFRPPQFPAFTADVGNTGFYGFPALPDGTVKIANHGAGRALRADEPRVVDAAEERRFRAFLAEAVPALADAPLARSRLCLYCDTADRHFLIDRDPDRPGLVVAAGGSGHAFKFAPVLGAFVADAVEGQRHAWSERFAWRRATGADAGARAGAARTDGPRADQARSEA